MCAFSPVQLQPHRAVLAQKCPCFTTSLAIFPIYLYHTISRTYVTVSISAFSFGSSKIFLTFTTEREQPNPMTKTHCKIQKLGSKHDFKVHLWKNQFTALKIPTSIFLLCRKLPRVFKMVLVKHTHTKNIKRKKLQRLFTQSMLQSWSQISTRVLREKFLSAP